MRWVQRLNEETGKHEFIPRDEAALARDRKQLGRAGYIHGDIESFVSPVDGSVISDRVQLREHNKRNNVVNTADFGTEHWETKRKERERFFNGEHTPAESLARKQEIYENIMKHERAN